MLFEERRIVLKDGRACNLRPVEVSDAQSMIDYLRTVSGETPFLMRYPEEIKWTVEGESTLLASRRDSLREIMMVAEIEGRIAGNVCIDVLGTARRVSHRCGLAIALEKDFWGLGIGSSLMDYALELARQMGYEQVELDYIDGNDRARHLYCKFGFVETGKVPHAIKYDDGTYRDLVRMALTFSENRG